MSYTHLHLHTEYSMLDGANKIDVLAKRLQELGMRSVAMTDHGNLFGAIDFYKKMKKYGITPIIGLEAYLHNAEDISEKSKVRYHLCLYAKNELGYKNLMKLSSHSFLYGLHHGYPRINKQLLRECSEGLICSSACLAGEVNFHLNQTERNLQKGAGGYEEAKRVALEYKDIFGEDFYLELMRHGIREQEAIDMQILRLAKECDIKIIATNDAHYPTRDDAEFQEVAMCIGLGRTMQDATRLRHSVQEFYVKSYDEMAAIFCDVPQALVNTQEIAQKCENFFIDLKDEHNPPTPPTFKFTAECARAERLDIYDDEAYFAHKSREGLRKRLAHIPVEKHQAYIDRLEYEINIISSMKFAGYMLIVWDYIHHAKKMKIPVGPGRGSVAGSLVAFCLEITDIDPLQYNLLFERFLNPQRVSMPDIDIDFCQRRRGEIMDYMIDRYGKHHVAQVITFGKMKAKAVIRDVARVLDMPIKEADSFAKLIPKNIDILKGYEKDGEFIEGAWELEPKIKEKVASDPLAARVWEFALKLVGFNRNSGKHAAALVLDSQAELWHKTPLFATTNDAAILTQYAGEYLEAVDLIKFDFLGLKTLTVIDDALRMITERYGTAINFLQIDINDKHTYELLQSGDTIGVFQIESSMFQALIRRLKPTNFEDIVALIALGRPGPMDSGMVDDFINRKHGLEPITYLFPELEPILKHTYGSIVYQEQIMQIVQVIAGFSLGEADLIRRAMGKKDEKIMTNNKQKFLQGAVQKGFDKKKASELWEQIVQFAGYGFNKSHSAAYAMLTFETAYLKAHYKHEFMAALITSESSKIDNVAAYIEEAKKRGIETLSPHVNLSNQFFSVVDIQSAPIYSHKSAPQSTQTKKIVFGLKAIKGVGEDVVESIINCRKEGGEFKNLEDFIARADFSKITKRVIEPLIKSGSLDGLGYTRATMLEYIDDICEIGRNKHKLESEISNSLFAVAQEEFSAVRFSFTDKEELHKKMLLEYEYECLGIYISGHPLDEYRAIIEGMKGVGRIRDLNDLEDGSRVMLVVKIIDIERRVSKKGNMFGDIDVIDLSGNTKIKIFKNIIEKLDSLDMQAPLVLSGKIEASNDKQEISVFDIFSLDDAKGKKIRLQYKQESNNHAKEHKEHVDKALVPNIQEPHASSCALGLVLDRHADMAYLARLSHLARQYQGDTELHIVIKDADKKYVFVSELKVNSAIKKELHDVEWEERQSASM